MKNRTLALAAILSAGISLAACADSGYYESGRHGYNHGRASARVVYNDGYYDNYYGNSIYGGYWGPSDVFYYQTGRNGPWIPDNGRHFRRDRFDGGVSFHVRDWRNR